ncbi:SIS domain-containing protein, partial [Streptomyces albidoflavus]|uniref:SIS domain-containing protein n=1 Tax=Streptomyces albidoflavus TaxID=1886 RepID=UPI0034A130B6
SRSTCPAPAPSRPAATEHDAAPAGATAEARCRYMPVPGAARTPRWAPLWLPAASVPRPLLTAGQWTFLGRGWAYGLAQEAALKMREAAGAWTESYPAMEYRHGPIAITAPGRVTWLFGEAPAGLADDVHRVGGHFEHHPTTDPLADLIRAQRLAVALAETQGHNPDRPRNLTRSVVLATDDGRN